MFSGYIVYIVCLLSLDITSSKVWFIYINESLHARIQQSSSDTAEHLFALHSQSRLLWLWCHLPANSKVDVNNLLTWAPCGSIQYVTMQMHPVILWTIEVNFKFSIEISFHVFNIDASGEQCLRSALVIYTPYKSRRLCGCRKPWSELVNSNIVKIVADQIDVINIMKLSFTYSVIDQIKLSEKILQLRTNNIKLKDIPQQQLMYTDLMRKPTSLMWHVHAPIGKRIVITASIDEFDHLWIYEGFHRHHLIQNDLPWKGKRAKFIHHYVACICIRKEIKSYTRALLLLDTLTFWLLTLEATPLSLTTKRARNFGGIYYKLFSIKPELGSFPNVSFHIRQFDGWHEGGCTYGGFLFKQYLNISQLETQTLGPYCTNTEPNHPLTGTDGLDYVVFGKYEVLLIIYASGPLFTIDMDIVISHSPCEGIVSLEYLCSFAKATKDTIYEVKFPSFTISCWSIYGAIAIRFIVISRCTVLQSLEKEWNETLVLDVTTDIHFHVIIKIVNTFLLYYRGDNDTSFGLKYKQENKATVSEVLQKSRVLTKQRASLVSIISSVKSRRMYYTYSLYVQPIATSFSCPDITLDMEKYTTKLWDIQYGTKIITTCGFGSYKESVTYVFHFDVRAIDPEILFLQFTTSQCESNTSTPDVLTACPSVLNCYAIDIVNNSLQLQSSLIRTSYVYEKNSVCSSFTMAYNFASYNVIATMLHNNSRTIIDVSMGIRDYCLEQMVTCQVCGTQFDAHDCSDNRYTSNFSIKEQGTELIT